MRRSGHFEFGLDRRPMHLGDGERVRRIGSAWAAGDEGRGLALYWGMVYGYLAGLLAAGGRGREAARVVGLATLRAAPAATRGARRPDGAAPEAETTGDHPPPATGSPPSYRGDFSAADPPVSGEETAETARLWGY